jgi:serine/threonine-protein kinase ULK/ATG1
MPPYPPSTSDGSPFRYGQNYSISSRNASSALSKALNMASKRLFGDKQSPPLRAQTSLRNGTDLISRNAERDSEANALLVQLEDLAQKIHVIARWCDDMYEEIRGRENGNSNSIRSHRTQRHDTIEPDCNDLTCTLLYLLVMSFCQRGIDSVSKYQRYLSSLIPQEDLALGGGFDEGRFHRRNLYLIN